MLKELLTIFRKDSGLDQAFRRSYEMIDITKDMFLKAKRTLRETDTTELDTSVYEQDKKINKYQKEVRKDVLQHLSIAGVDRLSSGLTLVSIIIDIERIGDYTKNILELAENYKAKLHAGNGEEDLAKVEKAVLETFDHLRFILENTDEEAAVKLIREYLWVNPLCDKHIVAQIREEDKSISGGRSVTVALYFRYLKRINSHLRNITTSVSRPFHKIGFVSKKHLKG